MEKETPQVGPQKIETRLYELLKACNDHKKPNPKARKELQLLVQDNSACQQIMQEQEGLYNIALRNRLDTMQSSDAFKEVIKSKCKQLRIELGYESANQLERLAIEQIVLCWLNYYQTEMSHASMLAEPISRETGIYWEKRLAFASCRYTKALEMLSKMRKMNLTVKISSENKQIIHFN